MRCGSARAVIVAVVLLSVLAPRASADNGVRVQVNGKARIFLSRDDVDAFNDGVYRATTRYAPGQDVVNDERGTPVAKVALLAHIPLQYVESMEIPRVSAGGVVTISGDEVRGGFDGDPLGHRVATIWTDYGHGVRFFRPLRVGDTSNVLDAVTTFNDNDLEVRIRTTNAAARQVVAHADDTTPRANTRSGFSVRVDDPPAGVAFTYEWDWGDGTRGSGPAPSHAFAPGHYNVSVQAFGDDGSSGVASPIAIQVAAPVRATPTASPTPTPTPSHQGQGSGPPGGGEGDDKHRASGPRRGNRRNEESSPAPTATPAASATATPAAGPTATPTAEPDKGGRAGSGRPDARERQALPSVDSGVRVEGIVLASAGSPAEVLEAAKSAAAADRSAARRGGGGAGGTTAGWVAGSGLLVALLAAGAASEGAFRRRLSLP